MQLRFQALELQLETPFRIAHGTSQRRSNVLVRVDESLGEAAAVSYHGESPARIVDWLRRAAPVLHARCTPTGLEAIRAISRGLPAGSNAARAAVDQALCDAWATREGRPLCELLRLDPSAAPATSFTVPLDEPERMADRARRLGKARLKMKLGATDGRDGERFAAVMAVAQAPVRVDANGGMSRESAERWLPSLAERGVELIEQPLPVGDLEGLRRLSRMRTRPPLFADESIKTLADLERHAGLVDGVVIKLAKSGGVLAALAQIERARQLGLQVMLGCMIESSVAVTAAAHLASLADHVDLDAPTLLESDPFEGIRYGESDDPGRLVLPQRPGLGVRAREGASP